MIGVEADKPSGQEIVVQLLVEHQLAVDAVDRLQKNGQKLGNPEPLNIEEWVRQDVSAKTMISREGGMDSRQNPFQWPKDDLLIIIYYSELIHLALLDKGLPISVHLA
jgi:hypothetical protein